ncbi:MAG: HAD hydrolase-like protein [Candidatus Anammoximicrobium sp.]|nr:HAD hydrolase-like protein [Candidatus Anammoximicrobium sp.]
MHVLFFDIDGTLINTGGSGVESLRLAFSEVFACPPPDAIPTSGRTDRGIARDLFQSRQIANSEENWLRFHAAYIRHLREQLPLRPGRVLPGVVRLLDELAARRHVALGLLTGNVEEAAWLKLQHFGLDHHFAFGGFGERSGERNAVAEDALAAARQALNGGVHPDRLWVIGDTPLDVQCARHIGAQAVAVATGLHDRADLTRAAPDLLLDDFSQPGVFLQRLDEAKAA